MPVLWLYALGSVILVSLISLIGVITIPISEKKLKSLVFVLVSLATGALFGDAFIHLLPQAFRDSTSRVGPSAYVLLGIFTFFILEKFLRWRHEHVLQYANSLHHLGIMNLVADGLHNMIDGMLIGASYLVGVKIGVATTLAVVLHEVPQEIGDFGILLHAGYSRRRALLYNYLSASVAVLGTIFALTIGSGAKSFSSLMLPLTAGGFIYIAGSDLMPELHKENAIAKSLVQLVALSAGVGLMLLLLLVE